MPTTESKVTREFWPKLKSSLGKAPFAEDAVAAFYCAFDPATPLRTKSILLAALAYFIMPVDIIPDFILGLGFTDDMAVLYAAFAAIQSSLRPEHRDKARAALENLKKT